MSGELTTWQGTGREEGQPRVDCVSFPALRHCGKEPCPRIAWEPPQLPASGLHGAQREAQGGRVVPWGLGGLVPDLHLSHLGRGLSCWYQETQL